MGPLNQITFFHIITKNLEHVGLKGLSHVGPACLQSTSNCAQSDFYSKQQGLLLQHDGCWPSAKGTP